MLSENVDFFNLYSVTLFFVLFCFSFVNALETLFVADM